MKSIFVLIIVTFVLHITWESLHVSLYGGYENISPYVPITVWATIGDVIYTLGAIFLVSLFKQSLDWIRTMRRGDYIGLAFIGFFISVFVEYKAMVFERWYYLESMPVIPGIEVGLSPVLQMTLLLPLSLYVAKNISSWLTQRTS